ncbi:hypothetical protein WJX72_010389 [[Myrmecia] bisecta]|uniref:Uncharacterized protein n=1 Tax=[Myrmecia] bisecta TaxID=41462 RepID=A0AAW1PGA8_9CHLO
MILIPSMIKACDLASDASKSAAEFFEKHRVQERAAEAGKQATQKLKETYEVVEDNVKRAASEVDSKFNVSEKAQQAAYKVREGAESIDTQLGIRRRLRIAAEDAQRKWPLWRKRYNDFIRTPVGRVMFGAFIFWLVYSGLAIRLVQIVFWTMWLAPFFLIPIANKFGRKMQNEMAAQAAAQQAARQRAANPFRSAFFGSRPGPSAGPAGPAGRSRASRYEQADAGPIIDAEWTTIDEGDRK